MTKPLPKFGYNWGKVDAPWWSDKPVLVVGTGPSLKGFDLGRLQGLGYILAVKAAIHDLPFADAGFGLDLPWMKREYDFLSKLTMPLYLSIPVDHPENAPAMENAIYLRRRRRHDGLSENPEEIESGGNSGFGGFNLATLKRAKLIYLFGFDYTGSHYCPEHYKHQTPGQNAVYLSRWATNFTPAMPQLKRLGIKVKNASPNSNVRDFEKCTLEEAIYDLQLIKSNGAMPRCA